MSKDDEIIEDYNHKLIGVEQAEDKKVYVIESIPHESAPVVWGKEIIKVREDYIILLHDFYDQDMNLIKRLSTKRIEPISGKLYATLMRMEKIEEKGEWTEVETLKARFNEDVPAWLFTLSNLKNPRR